MSWLRNLQYQRIKKEEHKEEAKAEEEETAVEDDPVPLVTHVNNILHSVFPMLKSTSTINNFTTLKACMRTNRIFPEISREPSPNTRKFCTARDTTKKKFLVKLWKRLCLNLFLQGEWKRLADLMASCCIVNWGLTFPPLLNCYFQIWEIGYD